MLARIRVGDRRFIAAASGPPRGSQPLLRMDACVLRDLDLTAAYGFEAAYPPKGQRGCRIPVNRH
jgi:hypothetical protein